MGIQNSSIMKEKQFKLNHVNLFYRDNERGRLPVFFIHGNSLHGGLFYKQFEALSQYRLIVPDLPGHGQSQFSEDPARDYGVGSYIRLLAEFIQSFNFGKCILLGHSLGGHLAIHLADQLRNITGLAIMGTPPLTLPPRLNEAFLPHPAMGCTFQSDLNEEEINLLASSFIDPSHSGYDLAKESILTCDNRVRSCIGQSLATDLTRDEAGILKELAIPLAVFHGENDPLVNDQYIQDLNLPLWNNRIRYIPQAGHSAFLENPGEFNSCFKEFLDDL